MSHTIQKSVVAAIPLIAALSQSAIADDILLRKAFFMQGNVGYGSSSFTKEGSKYSLEFSGSGPEIDLRLGMSFSGLWAFHANIDFLNYDGDWTYKSSTTTANSDCENSFYHVSLGVGGTLYPFREEGFMLKGLFFGAGVSLSMLRSEEEDGKDYHLVNHDMALTTADGLHIFLQESAVTFKFEAGETWRLGNSRWFLGTVLTAATDLVYATKYEDDTSFDYSSWTIGLAVTVMKR